MSKIRPLNGQSVYDLALIYYGSIEKVDKILKSKSVTSLTQYFRGDEDIELDDIEDNLLTNFFKNRKCATGNVPLVGLTSDEGQQLTGDSGQILFGDI